MKHVASVWYLVKTDIWGPITLILPPTPSHYSLTGSAPENLYILYLKNTDNWGPITLIPLPLHNNLPDYIHQLGG